LPFPPQAMQLVCVKNTFLDEVKITDERTRLRSRSCPEICSRSTCATIELVLTEPPRVRSEELDSDEDMDLSTLWSARSRNRGREPFMMEVFQPIDHSEESSNSWSAEPVAEELNQAKKSRPCKAKRNRYKRLVDRLQRQICENPEVFTMDQVALPPSLQANDRQRLRLIDRLIVYRNEVLTAHGE